MNLLRQYGDDIDNKRVIEKVLRSLPKKFEPVVIPIEEFKYLSQMHIDELTGSLIAYESRMSRYDEGSLEHAFKSQLQFSRGRGGGKSSSRGRGGRFAGQMDSRNESVSEGKPQRDLSHLRGSSSKPWKQ